MYTYLCDNLLTYVLFYFIVNAAETAKTATMATTNNTCTQLDGARTQNNQKQIRRVPWTDIANYAFLFSYTMCIIMFSSIRGFTVHLNDHSWKQNWGVGVVNTWTNFGI